MESHTSLIKTEPEYAEEIDPVDKMYENSKKDDEIPNGADIKDYAETTMNELLGLYGYEKVDSQDTHDLKLGQFHSPSISPGSCGTHETASDAEPLEFKEQNAETGSSHLPTDESDTSLAGNVQDRLDNSDSSLAAQHKLLVSALVTGKSSSIATDDNDVYKPHPENINQPVHDKDSDKTIICAWCLRPGAKLFTLTTENGTKMFCSELCFTQCRRASFKNIKICDWCKHIRHTVNYVDFKDGDEVLQFCSNKCLNQYKMNIFCSETQEHLKQIGQSVDSMDGKTSPGSSCGSNKRLLITPDLWNKKRKKRKRKNVHSLGRDGSFSFSHFSTKLDKSHKNSLLSKGKKIFNTGADDISPGSRDDCATFANTNLFPSNRSLPFPCDLSLDSHVKRKSHIVNPISSKLFNTNYLKNTRNKAAYISPFQMPPSPVHMLPGSNIPTNKNTLPFSNGLHPLPAANCESIPFHPYTHPYIHSFPPPPQFRIPQIENVNVGIPSMTMMMPFPFILPIPIPVPIPLPVDKQKVDELLRRNQSSTSAPTPSTSCLTSSKVSHNASSPNLCQDTVAISMSERCSPNISPSESHSSKLLSPVDNVSCPKKSSHSRRCSSATCAELVIDSMCYNPLKYSSSYDDGNEKTGSLCRSPGHSQNYIKEGDDMEAIDLSSKSCSKYSGKENSCELNGDVKETGSSSTIPQIYIVSASSEVPLSQNVPLLLKNTKYSKRRGLILDAPSIPKAPRSPTPERFVYIRTQKGNILEARRRCGRSRIRTK